MRPMHRTSIVVCALAASLAVVALSARSAPLGPDAAVIRAAVARSLPLLQSSADTWFQKRQCASCHHQGLGLIAVTVAREQGFPIDEALLRGQLERTLRPARNWQEKFVTGEVSINEAIGQSYRAIGVGTAGGTRTQMTDAMSYLLAGRQHVTGRWPSYSRRPPLEDSEFTATALTIRALRLFPLKGREAEFDDLDRDPQAGGIQPVVVALEEETSQLGGGTRRQMEVPQRIECEVPDVLTDRTDARIRPVDQHRAVIVGEQVVRMQIELAQRARESFEARQEPLANVPQ